LVAEDGKVLHGLSYPAVVQSSEFGDTLCEWAAENIRTIEETLLRHGAILFKRTSVATPEQLQEFAGVTSTEMPNFKEESSPRSSLGGHVYTSTDYPNKYPIQFHSEYSYAARWPMKLYFCCFQPSASGGETPIADTRLVLSNLRPTTRELFEKKGVVYLRNYRPNVGVSWQRAFSTDDRNFVEKICADAKIECEWRNGGVLRTRQYGTAILAHPKTKELVWFNHAFFFNVHAMEPLAARNLLLNYPVDDPLSTNTFFGDNSPIDPGLIQEIGSSYQRASVGYRWERGDVLLVDNMLSSHSRSPFTGKRSIAVVMADSCVR
jgi:alpha-ketoglutarate-dependent taurine dioxygenase